MEPKIQNKYTLIDVEETWQQLLPLTFVRNISEIRIGILTLKEKWEHRLKQSVLLNFCVDYLKTNLEHPTEVLINSSVFPTPDLVTAIVNLPKNTTLVHNGVFVASNQATDSSSIIEFKGLFHKLNYPWEIYLYNDRELRSDFDLLTNDRTSQPIDASNKTLGSQIFIEEGAKVQCAILNSTTGPIYIAKDAEVMEGSIIRGPFSLGEHSQTKMGTKIYGATTIGPHCKVGGEIGNSVFFGYSNKAHDGYLGNSIIGEWCNLGADTNSSNLKNNYSKVDVYSYAQNGYVSTGEQFCGLIMGDYSKCGINTMFNTGTVVGVCANIFGGGFPSKHIPSFSWCSVENNVLYQLDKALETIKTVYQRRGLELDERTISILTNIYNTNSENVF